MNSNCCESWDATNWSAEPSLQTTRESCTACVHETIYVFSRGIEVLRGTHWEVLKIQFDLIGCLGYVSGTQIFVLGGRSLSSYNSKLLSFPPTGKSLSEEVTGLFGANPLHPSFCSFTNTGKVIDLSALS